MNRHRLLELLNNYFPNDELEIVFKQRMIEFVKNNIDCFERSLEVGHITASCWLLNKDKSKALLMHHVKMDRWCQLGGHCDGDPDVLAVAVKEAQEESGMVGIRPVMPQIFDIDIYRVPVNAKEPEHDHYDVRFLLYVASDEDFVQNRESKELRWIGKSIDELPTDNPSVVRMFNKWLSL